MIDINLVSRKPVHRIVDMYFDIERTHLEESVDEEGIIEWTDDELFNHCVHNDIDHIWLDFYIVRSLIEQDDEDDF